MYMSKMLGGIDGCLGMILRGVYVGAMFTIFVPPRMVFAGAAQELDEYALGGLPSIVQRAHVRFLWLVIIPGTALTVFLVVPFVIKSRSCLGAQQCQIEASLRFSSQNGAAVTAYLLVPGLISVLL